MAEPIANPQLVLRLQPSILVGLIALAHIAFTALINPFRDRVEDPMRMLLVGGWYAQPLMFALWLALGTGRFSIRFQWTVLAFALLLLASRITALNRFDPEDLPIRLAMFVVTAIGMLIVRWRTGGRIARETDPDMSGSGRLRFSVKSLLMWTTFLAGLLVICRYTWSFINPIRLGDLKEIGQGTCIYGLVFGPLVFISLVLLSRRSVFSRLVFGVIIGWPVAMISAAMLLISLEPNNIEVFEIILLVSFGGALVCCLTVLPLRFAGYRVMTRNEPPAL